MSTSSAFPDPVYADTILAPQFAASQRWLFGPMLDASEAHLLMLQATGLMSAAQARRVWDALQALHQAGPTSFAYDPHVEDLFFQMEARIVELAGEEAGGNLHLARSRNDLDAAMARLALRRTLLEVHGLLERLRLTLLRRIEEHVETLMPGHTHTQPAQPTTLGHFLAATAEALERDTVRVQAAFTRTNRGPLGAAALTTTGFPIDRDLTARLLGFNDVVINSYDAIGGVDYALESLSALTTCVLGLARLIHELLLWATREYGTLRIDDSFIQISSIMPQKRNPVVLEHLRARVGWVMGSAATAQTLVHGAAFGDTVDVEDELYEPLFRTFEHGVAFLRLADAALGTCQFDKEKLAARATEGFTTATEIADTLVRVSGLSFRQAHRVASTIVRRSDGEPSAVTTALVSEAAREALGEEVGRRVKLSPEQLQTALDPWAFVRSRTIPGGPAPETVLAHVGLMRETLRRDAAWRERAAAQIERATAERREIAAALS
jgi:argininosuccinate lyase